MTIDWRPMTEWPPKGRAPNDEFLFWQPATAGGRAVLGARAVVGRVPPGPRSTTRWARIDPPKTDAEANRVRLLHALRLVNGRTYLNNFFWGPRHADDRAMILSALTGTKVPKSKAGFTAFREALYAATGVDGFPGTPNARENRFAAVAAELLRDAEM